MLYCFCNKFQSDFLSNGYQYSGIVICCYCSPSESWDSIHTIHFNKITVGFLWHFGVRPVSWQARDVRRKQSKSAKAEIGKEQKRKGGWRKRGWEMRAKGRKGQDQHLVTTWDPVCCPGMLPLCKRSGQSCGRGKKKKKKRQTNTLFSVHRGGLTIYSRVKPPMMVIHMATQTDLHMHTVILLHVKLNFRSTARRHTGGGNDKAKRLWQTFCQKKKKKRCGV